MEARYSMRRQDWALFAAVGGGVLGVAAVLQGDLLWAAAWAMLTVGAGAAARVWSVKYRGPMPHRIRWVLLMPRGPHSPRNLERILEPRSGERILDVGPGVGIYALPVASALLPNGVLDALDLQEEMLDDLKRRAANAGITNIVAKQGDARALPYPDDAFDGAYLIGVLGEIPDDTAALREIRRVLKPRGRLVVGEILIDPDYVSFPTLKEKARDAGFVFERKAGTGFAYFALFRTEVVDY